MIRWLCEALVRLYLPRRHLVGAEHVPARGPALYVLNHPNGLLDPVLLRIVLARPIRFLAKSTFFENPVGRLAMAAFDCLPVFRRDDPGVGLTGSRRNRETFARCRDALLAGDEIALFPEGTTHSDPQLRPLKTGAARIALAAAEHRPPSLTVVPVALHYTAKTVFRTPVHVVVAEPIALLDHVQLHAEAPRAAVAALTDAIADRLTRALHDATRLAQAASAATVRPARSSQLALLLALAPIALVGAVTSYLPYRLAAPLAAAITKDVEVLSTVKLLAGALLLTVAWCIEVALAAWLVGAAAAIVAAASLPTAAFAALRFSETARDLFTRPTEGADT